MAREINAKISRRGTCMETPPALVASCVKVLRVR